MTAEREFDAIVVGARCAGSPLAAELARRGADVLLLDRDEFPSDTLSTHFVFPNTLVRLEELGALDRLQAKHTLNFVEHRFQILGQTAAGTFTPIGGFERAIGVRRPVLDLALVETAIDAGAKPRFGERAAELIGTGTEDDPVAGVVLESGERLSAPWVFGADGRASFVAGKLGLRKEQPMAGDMSLLFAYFRGLPDTGYMELEGRTDLVMTLGRCEDDVSLVSLNGPPDFTPGSAAERERRFLEGIRTFPETLDPAWLDDAELISEIRVAPETMLRGFFRASNGPGWALVGDAGHFKHPATAQGISDAIEQALFVAGAIDQDGSLDGYADWRDERAKGHYEFSFDFGSMPKEEVAGPMFGGIARDPEAAQDFRDILTRRLRPREAISKERLKRWFAEATIPATAD